MSEQNPENNNNENPPNEEKQPENNQNQGEENVEQKNNEEVKVEEQQVVNDANNEEVKQEEQKEEEKKEGEEQNLFSTIGPCHIDQKGPYAFVDYETSSAAREAIKKFHRTTLNGLNGYNRCRVEISKRVKNQNSQNSSISDKKEIEIDERHKNYDRYEKKEERKESPIRSNNVCFICKLPGHFAKECVLTRDSCYECGEKGHMAKECQAGIRQAKALNYNGVRAVFSQQSSFKYLSHKQKFKIYINAIKEDIN